MTAHVFIVDAQTFKVHLEYLFAGTGAKNHVVDFNNNPNSTLHHSTENMLTGMIADACRIRRGDKIIFYVQQSLQNGMFEGRFYGIFKTSDNWSFLDGLENNNAFLHDQLGKLLIFRTLIKPYTVYAKGVTEWEALDQIKCLTSPNQMLWSLIYRKLRGNRGNTMITTYEAERLFQLIRNKNNRIPLDTTKRILSFDFDSQNIITKKSKNHGYSGSQEQICVLPRLIKKYRDGKSFEVHLQAYITKNIGLGINTSLDNAILGEDEIEIEWLGNEVSCGVGMQRIDLMLFILQNKHRVSIAIELKAIHASEINLEQMKRYIN